MDTEIVKIRREKLRHWVAEHGAPSKEKSYFSQLANSDCSFGEKSARRIEKQYKMGFMYLDTPNASMQAHSDEPTRNAEHQILDRRRGSSSGRIEGGASDVEDAPEIIGALKKIPVVGRVQAGPDGQLSIDDFSPSHGDGYMFWWSTCPSAYALRVRGESMSPRYLPGEFVGVDPCADAMPSDEVIVQLKNGQSMIKRLLWKRDDQVCFESVNKNFQNIVLDLEDIDKLHLVLGNIPKAAFRSE